MSGEPQQLGFDTRLAACRGHKVSTFYPDPEQAKKKAYSVLMAEAVRICDGCEVKEPCLEYAIQNEPVGIWGGTTEMQRHRMRLLRGVQLPALRPLPDSVRRNRRNKQSQ